MTREEGEGRRRAAWTVLVYMAGDNNLTEEMAWGLQELKKTAVVLATREGADRPGQAIKVVAHFDPRGSRSRRYDFVPANAVNEPVPAPSQDGNLDSYVATIDTRRSERAQSLAPHPDTLPKAEDIANPLARFVSEQVGQLSEAEQYFLILSGHGSGAVGDFLIDSNPRTSLSIPGLALLLASARKAYAKRFGADGEGKRISILGMDSCLMSNAETCYEVRDHADYIVGSEGWVANAGWPYHRVLEGCLKDQNEVDSDAESVAIRVARNYASFYRDYEISGLSTDIAVCSLDAFEPDGVLVSGLREVSRAGVGAFDAVHLQRVQKLLRDDPAAAPDEQPRARAATLLNQLIGQLVACLTLVDDKEAMRAQLVAGPEKAMSALRAAFPLPAKASPKRRALREFLETVRLGAGLPDEDRDELRDPAQTLLSALDRVDALAGDELAVGSSSKMLPDMNEAWRQLAPLLDEPRSASVALAVVRLKREWDPGVLEVLQSLERQERLVRSVEARPRARQGRAILQKLHQVRSVMDACDLGRKLPPSPHAAAMLNAVVASRWRAQSFKGGVYVDLYDLCACLDGLSEAAAAAVAKVRGSIRDVVRGSFQTGQATQHAKGLSVYFPSQTIDYSPEYENLAFARATGWGRLVRSYLRATRRERRDEVASWVRADTHLLRFGHSEVDPLEADGIEARIVGVIAPPLTDAELSELADSDAIARETDAALERISGDCVQETITSIAAEVDDEIEETLKAGLEQRIKAGLEPGANGSWLRRLRAGLEQRIRAGLEQRIRAGLEQRIKAELDRRIRAGLEQRIKAGLEQRIKAGLEQRIKAGLEQRIKAGLEQRIKAGLEQKIRAGTEAKIRSGTEAKIRGEGALFEWGNPPDGFFRPREQSGNGTAGKPAV